ncbi:MAG: Fic/DOC family N-terminal domain-containing protein, partial [Acidimicrobiales bacterium]
MIPGSRSSSWRASVDASPSPSPSEPAGASTDLGAGRLLPDPHLLVRPYLRREAVASTRIEGTLASLVEVFDAEANDQPPGADVEEVVNYVAAMLAADRTTDSVGRGRAAGVGRPVRRDQARWPLGEAWTASRSSPARGRSGQTMTRVTPGRGTLPRRASAVTSGHAKLLPVGKTRWRVPALTGSSTSADMG